MHVIVHNYYYYTVYTVICENFGHFVESDKKFSCKTSLPVLIYTANIWHTLEVDEILLHEYF